MSRGREFEMESIIKISKVKGPLKVLFHNRLLDKIYIEFKSSELDIYEFWSRMTFSVLTKLGNEFQMAKIAFNRKRITGIFDRQQRKKLLNCYMWSVAIYRWETGTLRKVRSMYLESKTSRFYAGEKTDLNRRITNKEGFESIKGKIEVRRF